MSAFSMLQAAYQAEVEFRNCNFKFDADTQTHISMMATWLSESKTKCGMLLCGTCGNGKSTIVRALQNLVKYIYRKSPYDTQRYLRIIDAKEIVYIARKDYGEFKRLCATDMLAIDDLGIEPSEVLEFGNVINPAIDLLSHRYNEQLFTVVTTNLTPQQIREHYGDRIADRFNEMMQRIVFTNPSYRSTN